MTENKKENKPVEDVPLVKEVATQIEESGVDFVPKKPHFVKLKIDDTTIEVMSFMPIVIQGTIIQSYIEDLYNEGIGRPIQNIKKNRLVAEVNQTLNVMQFLTNVKSGFNIYNFHGTKGWYNVTKTIENWDEFIKLRDAIVADYEKEQADKVATGVVLKTIFEKLESLVSSIAEITPESIEALQETSISLLERLEENKIVEDMNRGKQ